MRLALASRRMRWETLALVSVAVTGCGRVHFAEHGGDAAVGVEEPVDGAGADAAMRVVLISDDFERDVVGGWGDAPIGGPWSEYNPNGAGLDVSGGGAHVAVTANPTYADFSIDTGSARDVETRMVVAFDRLPSSGRYKTIAIARQSAAATAFDLTAELLSDGSVVGSISASLAGVTVSLTTPTVAVTGVGAGERIAVMLRVTGAMPVQVCGSIWRASDAEPAACTFAGQEARAGLEDAGISYVAVNVASGPAPVTFSFDSFEYVRVGPQ